MKLGPDIRVDLRWSASERLNKAIYGFLDLSDLHAGIDNHADIVEAEADDLNGVFGAQRIVDQNQLV